MRPSNLKRIFTHYVKDNFSLLTLKEAGRAHKSERSLRVVVQISCGYQKPTSNVIDISELNSLFREDV